MMSDGVQADHPLAEDRSVYYIVGVTVVAECLFLVLSYFWL